MPLTSALSFFLLASACTERSVRSRIRKANNSGDRRSSQQWQAGGRYVAVNLPLLSLVSIAYQAPLYQITGLPDWVRSARFDIMTTRSVLRGRLG